MINVNALDNIIAVVVVILLLSLIVQSIQSVLKKAFKIKSRQIEDSLVDLFENVVNYTPDDATGAASKPRSLSARISNWLKRICGSSPVLRRVYQFLTRKLHPADPAIHPNSDVKKLFNEVIKGFEDIGRVAQTGKRMLDSISKEDLKKVMSKVLPNTLLTGFTGRLESACGATVTLKGAIKTINDGYMGNLSGDGKAKFAAMQQALAPLLNDLNSVYEGEQLSASLIIGDILHLREIDLTDVLTILGELQNKAAVDLAAAEQAKASGTPPAEGVISNLEKLSGKLGEISTALTRLSTGLDAAVAPLRTKLNEVETWYDTVTQSFEERYTRGMKTWAMVISFFVVAYLNASIFDIYKNVVTNDALRNQLVQVGEERTKANEQRLASAKDDLAKANSDQAKAEAATAEAGGAEAAKAAAAKAEAAKRVEVTLEDVKKDVEGIRKQMADLSGFGFQPLKWQDVKERFNTQLWFSNGRTDQEKEKDWGGWLKRRRDDFQTLAGWLLMTFLLSVGAPFWEDTLESLFGVKNLLRKRTGTKNVEAESGAGQTKP